MAKRQRQGLTIIGQLGLAVVLVGLSSLLRLLLQAAPGVVPFATYFPAVLFGTLAGGWVAACVSIILSLAAANFLFITPSGPADFHILAINNGLFAANAVAIAALGLYARMLLASRRLYARRLEGLLDEQNHRIKNNLSMVSSLLTLQAKAATEEAVRQELSLAVARVKNVADIHTQLYRGKSRETVDLRDYLSGLCSAFEGVLDRDRLKLECSIVSVQATMEQALPIGMIVVELLTNANKHAYSETGIGGVIRVRLEKARGRLKLVVSDKGKGLPLEAVTDTGLGVRVVRSLVNQLNAEMTISNTPGATFEISIPYKTPRSARDASIRLGLFGSPL